MRKHPLRRIMIGVAATASGVVLLLALKQPASSVVGASSQAGAAAPPAASASAGSGNQAGAAAPPAASASAGSGNQAGAAAPPAASASAGSGNQAGTAGSQTVLGDVAETQHGQVQVRLVVSGGKITAAEAVKAPDGDANSRRIAADAIPKLNQAVMTAQSADIDAVSGASYTSQGYIQSLQNAIDKAGL
jgi:hypothetical protein